MECSQVSRCLCQYHWRGARWLNGGFTRNNGVPFLLLKEVQEFLAVFPIGFEWFWQVLGELMTFLLDFSFFFLYQKSIKRCIHKRVFQTAKAIDVMFSSQESLGSPEDVGSAAAHRLLSEATLYGGSLWCAVVSQSWSLVLLIKSQEGQIFFFLNCCSCNSKLCIWSHFCSNSLLNSHHSSSHLYFQQKARSSQSFISVYLDILYPPKMNMSPETGPFQEKKTRLPTSIFMYGYVWICYFSGEDI